MATGDSTALKAAAEAQVNQFTFERLLNQGRAKFKFKQKRNPELIRSVDQAGRRISLLGNVDSKPAVLVVERAAFSSSEAHLRGLTTTLGQVQNLGANDIYSWHLAWTKHASQDTDTETPPDLKINLICPCTSKHIRKYSAQNARIVVETPEIYRDKVFPYMQRQHDEPGRVDWVYNILEGKTEVEDVIFRSRPVFDGSNKEDFLLLPDLNWDRKTLTGLHLLALVARRDIWSLRDLGVSHINWLKEMKDQILQSTLRCYPNLEHDQIKFYVHYQPTYYHFHIHVVHVMAEAGATQAVGKAWGLDSIINQLELMQNLAGADAQTCSMADVTMSYTVGEESDLWKEIFEPLKKNELKRKREEASE